MSRGTAFDPASDGLFGGVCEQLMGTGDIKNLVTDGALGFVWGGAREQLIGGARDLVWDGVHEQLAGDGASVWQRSAR